MELVPAQPGQVFRDDDADLAVFHVGHHLLETWTLKIRACVSVIHIKTGVWKMVIGCVPLKDHFLILNTV